MFKGLASFASYVSIKISLILQNAVMSFIFPLVAFGVRRPYVFKEVSPLMTCT